MHSVVLLLLRLRKRGRDPRHQARLAEAAGNMLMEARRHLWIDPDSERDGQFLVDVEQLTSTDMQLERIGKLLGQLQKRSKAASAKAHRKADQHFGQWLEDTMKAAPRHVHQCSKEPRDDMHEMVENEVTITDHVEMTEVRSQYWSRVWKDAQFSEEGLAEAMADLTRRAGSEDMEELAVEQLQQAAHLLPPRTAKGSDSLGPRDLQRMS